MIDLATGELAPLYGDGIYRVREPPRLRLPACSAVYKRDACQLIRAGLAGGKGMPESIAVHPCVFATFTAPSFGPVHTRRLRGKTVLPVPAPPRAKARRCPHGRGSPADPAQRGRHPPGQADVPGLLRLPSRRAVQRLRGQAVAPHRHHLRRHLAKLAGAPETLRLSSVSGTPRWPSFRPGRDPLPRHLPPGRRGPAYRAPAAPGDRRAAGRRHPPGRRRRAAPGRPPGQVLALGHPARRGADVRPIRQAAADRRRQAANRRPSPPTWPSTPPRPHRSRAALLPDPRRGRPGQLR